METKTAFWGGGGQKQEHSPLVGIHTSPVSMKSVWTFFRNQNYTCQMNQLYPPGHNLEELQGNISHRYLNINTY